ncbi:hypothetical protein D1P53_001509 [Cryptococcus gattii VGV]|nr:hypothetical protein D1P53_001509 [Cryptococcus gattii VGV]
MYPLSPLNRIIHRGLQSIQGAVVSLEPRTLEGQRRNDLRVRGRCGLHATDYDLKVYCLNDRDARSTTSAKPASTPLANHVLNRCLSWLDKISQNTTKKAPATHSGQFKAVVMSTGGLLSRETADEMRRWRKEMSPAVFDGMMRKISLELRCEEEGEGKEETKAFMYPLSPPNPTTSAKPASTPLANHVLNRCLSWLDKVSQNTTKKAPATHSGQFKAVVMSTGGLLSRDTADEMRRWRKEMSPAVFEGMMRKISLELVRARARTFAM